MFGSTPNVRLLLSTVWQLCVLTSPILREQWPTRTLPLSFVVSVPGHLQDLHLRLRNYLELLHDPLKLHNLQPLESWLPSPPLGPLHLSYSTILCQEEHRTQKVLLRMARSWGKLIRGQAEGWMAMLCLAGGRSGQAARAVRGLLEDRKVL